MIYARINLEHTNYQLMQSNWRLLSNPDPVELAYIYQQYCCHKKFTSVMPIFDSEYTDGSNDVIGYYDADQLVAFSLIRRYDTYNVEAIQFAWTYHKPKMRLGIRSLEHECALYKKLGYKFLYLGGADEYKKRMHGFEILTGY